MAAANAFYRRIVDNFQRNTLFFSRALFLSFFHSPTSHCFQHRRHRRFTSIPCFLVPEPMIRRRRNVLSSSSCTFLVERARESLPKNIPRLFTPPNHFSVCVGTYAVEREPATMDVERSNFEMSIPVTRTAFPRLLPA